MLISQGDYIGILYKVTSIPAEEVMDYLRD